MRAVFSKFHEENLRAIDSLNPAIKPLFYEFIRRVAIVGMPIRITSALRTSTQQDAEYAKGRTKPGRIVTWVRDSDSFHTWGLAIDIAPLTKIGPITFQTWYSGAAFAQLDRIAKELGIEHPYEYDKPHFQWTDRATTNELKKGRKIPIPKFERLESQDPTLRRVEERMMALGFTFI